MLLQAWQPYDREKLVASCLPVDANMLLLVGSMLRRLPFQSMALRALTDACEKEFNHEKPLGERCRDLG